MALIGTISGSVGAGGSLTSTTAISGSLIIASQPGASFPAKPADTILYVSAALDLKGGTTPGVVTFATDTVHSGSSYYQAIATPASAQGRLYLDNSDYALSYFTETGYRARPGRQHLFRARNEDTATITKGSAVRVTTSVGSQTTVVRALAITAQAISSEVNQIIGITVEDIAQHATGYVCVLGRVPNLNTSAYLTEGGILYVSNVTSGALTQTQPPAPYESIRVGMLVRSHITSGSIFIDPSDPQHLNDITGFSADPTTWVNGASVVYDSSTSMWKSQRNGYNISGSFNGVHTGSLTKLTDGTTDYLKSGTNISLTTGSDGSVTINSTVSSTTPGGANTEVQYNNSGTFGSDNSFYFTPASKTVSMTTGSMYYSSATLSYAPVFFSGLQTLTDAANIAWNLDSGSLAQVTLGGARNLSAPTNQRQGGTYTLIVKQDGSGNRTLTFDATYKFPYGGDPLITTASNAVDIVTFISDGTSMYGSFQQDFR